MARAWLHIWPFFYIMHIPTLSAVIPALVPLHSLYISRMPGSFSPSEASRSMRSSVRPVVLFLWSESLSECLAHSGTFRCYSFFWCCFVLDWMHPNHGFPSLCSFQLLLWLILKPRCRFSWSWNHQLHGTVSVQEFMWSGAVSLPIKLKTKISFSYLSWPMQNLSGGEMC